MARTTTIVLLLTVIALGFVFAPPASAAPLWSVFGNAQYVKQGVGDNPWAVELTSSCPTLPSFACFVDGSFTFSGIDFNPPGPDPQFADISLLSADFNPTTDDCGGGSPRFQLNIDSDGDGDFDGNVHIAIGPSPSFTGCAAGWQSTGNMIGNNDVGRYDIGSLGGSPFTTYSNALTFINTNFPNNRVLGMQLVVDGGWNDAANGADTTQTILVDNVHIVYPDHDHLLSARAAG